MSETGPRTPGYRHLRPHRRSTPRRPSTIDGACRGARQGALPAPDPQGCCPLPLRTYSDFLVSDDPVCDDALMTAQSGSGRARWQARYDAARKRDVDFTTLSGLEVEPAYGPREGEEPTGFEQIGWPGEYPYPRGLDA